MLENYLRAHTPDQITDHISSHIYNIESFFEDFEAGQVYPYRLGQDPKKRQLLAEFDGYRLCTISFRLL